MSPLRLGYRVARAKSFRLGVRELRSTGLLAVWLVLCAASTRRAHPEAQPNYAPQLR
jgi:hypothetical protein